MSRFVRPSKYRHTFANQPRKEYCYEGVKPSGSAWDTDLIKSNGKFLAVNWQVAGGGAFAILPAPSPFHAPTTPSGNAPFTTKLPDLIPLVRGHSAPVLDTAWAPHSASQTVLASAGEDSKICLWDFQDAEEKFAGWQEDGWVCPEDWTVPVARFGDGASAHGGRKVGQLQWNGTAEGILASAGSDHVVKIWDAKKESTPVLSLTGHKDTIQCIAWNYTGSLLATTSRDKKVRLFDPRAGSEPIKVADGHGGIKGSRVVWLGDRDRMVTTGFSKMSDRQMMLWDTTNLTSITTETIDSSSGVIMPFYAEGNDVLILAGKGDGNIRYFEYADDELHYLSEFKSSDPQRGFCLGPRHSLEVSQHEIARGYKLTTGVIEPLAFIVPRKAEGFQADIFPPAPSLEAALTAEEWLSGKTSAPKVIDLETKATTTYDGPKSTAPAASTPTPAPAPKEEPKPAPVKQSSVTEMTGKLPNMRDLEIKQDDPDSDEEITEAKKRAPSTGGFDDDDDEVVKPKPAEKASAETTPEPAPEAAKTPEPASKEIKEESAPAPANGVTAPNAQEDQSSPKELESLKRQLADASARADRLESENKRLRDQVEKAKRLAAELAQL
ncbi:hypothetical protein NliqN6_6140 [Naganishia liquefaciens]|uniref:Coronin n=1 Tax=Naganishia liquefaciens TaxID=104408 RepID=A0A8H3YHV4_9TREE|nr:hypothetical protein NliqN6_6140 [Naganishia liquefaciens]